MKSNIFFLGLVSCLLSLNSCKMESSPAMTQQVEEQVPSLATAFQNDFHIGAALGHRQINQLDSKETTLIETDFNTITPENTMKWMHIHPAPDSFAFEMPDKFVALGEKNEMYIVGHTLVWHSQLAPWVSEIKDSTRAIQHLENHINTIAGRYKGRIDGWDVVNEALNEDGTLRSSIFLELLGENYLQTAFTLAAKADPQADLFYNDYNICQPAKRKGTVKLIQQLQASNTKIDGVGIQAHWGLDSPALSDIEESIIEYASLGIQVMFTELDITVLPNPWDLEGADVNQDFEGNEMMNPYPASLPDSIQVKLAERYNDIFALFLKHKDKISRVTFWGVHDGHSWLNNWPIKNRTNYPLLFDRNFKPKRAYHSVLALKAEPLQQ